MDVRTKDKIATVVFCCIAFLIIGILLFLLGFILYRGLSHISWDFLTSKPESFRAGGGIGPQIFNSFYLLVLTMIITIPPGLLGGIYMSEYAKPGRLSNMVRTTIEVLSSLPSIVVGLFGLLLFVNIFGWGFSMISGALALTVFNLPLMVRITEQALQSVPVSQREASLALGLSKWRTIVSVVIPSALPGIITGTILACGRVFGEAAALMFTAGMSTPPLDFTNWNPFSPNSPLNPFRPAETLAVHIWKVNSEGIAPDAREIAAGASAVLVIFVLVFNLLARWFGRWIHRLLTSNKS